jgi:AcrR family transcriptional regulator
MKMAAHKKKPGEKQPRVNNDSRGQLIDVTLRVILEQGVDAVRIDDIVAEVGVTKGSLYWHFEDREALVKAALTEHIRRLSAETLTGVSEALDESSGQDDYLARVAPFIADPYDAEQVRDRWEKLAILVETRNHPELLEMMRDVQGRNIDLFVELMTQAQKAGVLRQDLDPRAVAAALNAMYLGSNVIDMLGDSAPTPDAWWGLITFFIGTLFPPPTDA